MDQIGKLYQNRAMVLQQEVNRLETLLEAVVQDPRPFTPAQQKIRDDFKKQENVTSRGRIAPPTPEDTGFQSTPNVKEPEPLQSDPAVQNAFSKYLENSGVSRVASSIQNIKELPGDAIDALYNKSPWMTILGGGAGALYSLPRGTGSKTLDALGNISWRLGMMRDRTPPVRFEPAKIGKPGFNIPAGQTVKVDGVDITGPKTVKPTFAEPSTMGGSFKPPVAFDTFETRPTLTTPDKIRDALKSAGTETLELFKPGGLIRMMARTRAGTRNDVYQEVFDTVKIPQGEADILNAGIKKDQVALKDMKELAKFTKAGKEQKALVATAAQLEKDIASRGVRASNAEELATQGRKAIDVAEQPGLIRIDPLKPIETLKSKFDYTPWAQRYFNPLTKMGARNLGRGVVGVAGGIIGGEATERGMRSMGVENEDAIGFTRAAVEGGVGTAAVLALGGLSAVTAPAVATGAVLGASLYGIQRGGEKLAQVTGLEDEISGMAAIRKTPGMTRGELEAKHPSTDPDLDDKTKAEYAEAAAAYLRRQAEKSGQAVQARSQDTRRTGTSKQ